MSNEKLEKIRMKALVDNRVLAFAGPLKGPWYFQLRRDDRGRNRVHGLLRPAMGEPLTDADVKIPIERIEAFGNDPANATVLSELSDVALTLDELHDTDIYLDAMVEEIDDLILRQPLYVPTTRPYPDAFYVHVAALYSGHAAEGRRPAKEVADSADVPITTAHRWVRECRHRGLLPPGRAGAAG